MQRPSYSEIQEQIANDISLEFDQKPLKRSFIMIFAKIWAAVFHSMYGYAAFIKDQILLITSSGEYLVQRGESRGVNIVQAQHSELTLSGTGSNGSVIQKDKLIKHSNATFKILQDSTVVDEVFSCLVRCLDPGIVGNLEPGEKLNTVESIPGIDSELTVVSLDKAGTEKETESNYKARVISYLQEQPKGGDDNHYKYWVKQAPSGNATKVWVDQGYSGRGTVGIFFINENNDDSVAPTYAEIAAVEDYLEQVKPADAIVCVVPLYEAELDFKIALSPNTEEVRTNVTKAIKQFLRDNAKPQALIKISQLSEAISLTAGEDSHTILEINGKENFSNPQAPIDFFFSLGNLEFVDG